MKASTQISAWTDFTRTYQGNTYDFHVYGTQADGLPQNYSFNSDVIDFVISKSGDAYNHTLYDSGIYVFDWMVNSTADLAGDVMSLFANAYIGLNSFAQDYITRNWIGVYLWEFEFTGADNNYVGSADYGPAYGFTFHGLCGDKIDLVLDSSGDFYGQNRLGNWTYGVNTPEYIPHIIHQADPDNIWIPSIEYGDFNDLKKPYIDGISLYYFVYLDGDMRTFKVNDFRDTTIYYSKQDINNYNWFYWIFLSLNNYTSIYMNGSDLNATNYRWNTTVNNQNISGTYNFYVTQTGFSAMSYDRMVSFNLPGFSGSSSTIPTISNYGSLGMYNNAFQSGTGNIYLKTRSYTPVTPSSEPIPVDVPIPIEQIPSDPEDPLPDNPVPNPVPGITYPVSPSIPLPPFATIVSGNDDLWGVTLEFEDVEGGLLPYMNSLSEFQFPSFSDLISDFSGSIIWVAQLMSILYNGTPLNVLFIALCLFSLVSVLIGAYKLWNSTEPDPGNPGMRRYKRPPKGGKKH